MIYKVTAAIIVMGLMAGTANAALKEVNGRHAAGWNLRFVCETTVKKGKTCKMQARLSHSATKTLKSNKVPSGYVVTVVLTIADKDTFSKDDIVLTETFTFKAGERVSFTKMLCGNLKKDLGKKSEIYAKVSIRSSIAGVGKIPLIGYKAKVKTPVVKVKTTK